MEADDMALLREYARDHSEQPFRTLVERHVDMVFAMALRQTGNPQLAEEVTQAVFTTLAQKASSVPQGAILAGWLFRATRFAASNVRRAEIRRERWEQKAAQMEFHQPAEPEMDPITPVLNEALEELPEKDRVAILLRFFERKSIEEVGRSLGTTENAAKMRLSRAVEKLRALFRQRGLSMPSSALLGVLAAQGAQGAPAGLVSTVLASALLPQTAASTLPLVKGTLLFMTKTNANKMAIAAIVLLLGSTAAFVAQQALPKPAATPPAGETKAPTAAATAKALVFRSVPSWNRNPDFEDALMALGTEFDVKSPDEMETTDLSRQPFIIIPGSQGRSDFYPLYAKNAGRFEQYVTNGGTLLLELNGAENFPLPLPRGVRMEKHFAKDNTILLTNHPIVEPLAGKTIRANYASHGFLSGVPKDALVLAVESVDGVPDLEKPTFIEYPYGAGRVIAACQCFHDQDRSGRGILMDTVLVYAAEKKWFTPKATK